MASDFFLVWIVDISKSMRAKGKINSVNMIIRETAALISDLAETYPSSGFFMRSLTFSDASQWVDPKFVNIQQYDWKDLDAGGKSDLGSAYVKITEFLKAENNMDKSKFVFILVTDGYPTDDWFEPFQNLASNQTFISSLKIAIAIPDTEKEILREFTGGSLDNGYIINVDEIEKISMGILSNI